MKRIVASILLLAAALFISKTFAAEVNDFTGQARAISVYTPSQNYISASKQASRIPFSSINCPCTTASGNSTITLTLIAAMAVSLTMATFIYGSRFIATWIVG
jgi:hypothetical protein